MTNYIFEPNIRLKKTKKAIEPLTNKPKGAIMTTQITKDQINNLLKANNITGYANVWQDRIIYINLSSKNNGWRGDRSYQIYFDLSTNTLVSKAGNGLISSDFAADVKKVELLFK